MTPSIGLEQELCKAYRAARIAFDLDPFDFAKFAAYSDAAEALVEFIRADGGAPAEDWVHFVQFEVDRWGELQEMPLMFNRFAYWAAYGAESVAPAFGRAG
jgi:hypothetical protein